MKFVKSIGIFCLLTASLLIAGCGDDEVTMVSISVTPDNPSVVEGNTQQFTAIGTKSDGSTQDLTGLVTWSSSNTAVATIDSAGLATAVTEGTATITATFTDANGTVSDSTTLTVTGGATVSIVGPSTACTTAYNPNSITISVGDTVTWTNNDIVDLHTVTSSASSGPGCTSGGDPAPLPRELDSGSISPGNSYSHTFSIAGTFNYVCTTPLHTMRGTVIVQ